MRLKLYRWLDRDFVALSAEGEAGAAGDQATVALVERFDEALRPRGLGLEHVVRTRLWARDRESRDLGSNGRGKALAGVARSASSSFIAPGRFASEAVVAMDLLAMRPRASDARKLLVEYEPPIAPLRYLVYDSIALLSGVTSEVGSLAEQIETILGRIAGSLSDAGSNWERVARVSCFLHHGQNVHELLALLPRFAPIDRNLVECTLVDGYSRPGKLIEIEVTARA